jgi:hypothetical protein
MAAMAALQWARITRGCSMQVEGLLGERVDVQRLSFGNFALNVSWTPVGHAPSQLRARGAEAA